MTQEEEKNLIDWMIDDAGNTPDITLDDVLHQSQKDLYSSVYKEPDTYDPSLTILAVVIIFLIVIFVLLRKKDKTNHNV